MCEEARIKTGPAEDPRLRGPFAGAQTARGHYANQLSEGHGPRDVDVAYRPTIRERLLKERANLQMRTAANEQAIAALDADPEFEKHDATRAALKQAGVYFD